VSFWKQSSKQFDAQSSHERLVLGFALGRLLQRSAKKQERSCFSNTENVILVASISVLVMVQRIGFHVLPEAAFGSRPRRAFSVSFILVASRAKLQFFLFS